MYKDDYLIWNKNSEVFIWGTGKKACQYFAEIQSIYKINGFIDNNIINGSFKGYMVFYPEQIDLHNARIIICVADYKEIILQCLKSGAAFGFNVITYKYINGNYISMYDVIEFCPVQDRDTIIDYVLKGRGLLCLNGNCQIVNTSYYMIQCSLFTDKYVLMEIPPVFLNNMVDEMFVNSSIFQKISLFITQEVSENNRFDKRLSTNEMILFFSKVSTVKFDVIRIPNLYFDLYFPQGGSDQGLGTEFGDVFPYRDAFVEHLSCFYPPQTVVEIVKSDFLFPKSFLSEYVAYRFNNLFLREEKCDIKIVDYIMDNYKKKQLFYCRNHPINELLRLLADRILASIGITHRSVESDEIRPMDIYQEFIYPSTEEGLSLDFSKRLYSDGLNKVEEFTLEEEILRYIGLYKRHMLRELL